MLFYCPHELYSRIGYLCCERSCTTLCVNDTQSINKIFYNPISRNVQLSESYLGFKDIHVRKLFLKIGILSYDTFQIQAIVFLTIYYQGVDYILAPAYNALLALNRLLYFMSYYILCFFQERGFVDGYTIVHDSNKTF